MLQQGLAAVGVAAAGALIITKPEKAWMVILAAGTALLLGWLAGWIKDMIQNRDDFD